MAEPDVDAGVAAGVVAFGVDEDEAVEPLEPHAAAPSARPAVIAATPRYLYLIVFPFPFVGSPLRNAAG
jgi:hypothetical protein